MRNSKRITELEYTVSFRIKELEELVSLIEDTQARHCGGFSPIHTPIKDRVGRLEEKMYLILEHLGVDVKTHCPKRYLKEKIETKE